MSIETEAQENRRARDRARQRARHETARRHRGFYLLRIEELRDVTRAATPRERNQAERDTAAAYPETYRRVYARELTQETITPLKVGGTPKYPCGTEQAYQRHLRRRGDVPCTLCEQAHEATLPERTCWTCDRTYRSGTRIEFCGKDCYRLWSMCLRFYEQWVAHELNAARSKLRRKPADTWALGVLAEYAETGTVTRKRQPGPTRMDTAAAGLARKVGVNLPKRIERARRDGGRDHRDALLQVKEA